jgi:hypothetical protein
MKTQLDRIKSGSLLPYIFRGTDSHANGASGVASIWAATRETRGSIAALTEGSDNRRSRMVKVAFSRADQPFDETFPKCESMAMNARVLCPQSWLHPVIWYMRRCADSLSVQRRFAQATTWQAITRMSRSKRAARAAGAYGVRYLFVICGFSVAETENPRRSFSWVEPLNRAFGTFLTLASKLRTRTNEFSISAGYGSFI